jgi:two-component sensor histidine kinase
MNCMRRATCEVTGFGHEGTARATFPGRADQVPLARRFVERALTSCSAADDAALLTSELVTNAVAHSVSGRGGTFTVTVTHRVGDLLVEVADDGGPWEPHTTADAQHGRGLLIVTAVARAWGVTGDDSGRVVWVELDCR